MNPSAWQQQQQQPTAQADQAQVDLPAVLGGGVEFLWITFIVNTITTGYMAVEECHVCLTTAWRRYYEAKMEQLRSASSALRTRSKEHSWSSTASKSTRNFFLCVFDYLLRAMYEKNQCALEQIRGGLFATADPDKPEWDFTADVSSMIQGCVERSTRVACERFLQVVWNRSMRGYALRCVVEAWTRQVEEAVRASGMFIGDVRVRAAATTIELRTLNTTWCQEALEKIDDYFKHEMKRMPELIGISSLGNAPRLWTDKSGRSSFEQSSLRIIKSGVIERQSRDDFIAGISLVANRMGIDLRLLLDGEPCIRDSAGQGTKASMKRFKAGTVKCHARICADRAWKAELVNAYWGKIADQFKMQDEVRAMAALSPSVVPEVMIQRDCSFFSPAC
jgi:hypothetical protein